MFGSESIAMIVIISSTQHRSTAVNNILAYGGSRGNSAIFLPTLVSNPSSSNAPKAYNCSIAAIIVYTGGGSMKSKFSRSWIPIAFNSRIVLAKLVLWISGTEVGSISLLKADSVYNL